MSGTWATFLFYSRHAGRECRNGITAAAGVGRFGGAVPWAGAAPALRRAAPLRPAPAPRPRHLHILGHCCRHRRCLRANPLPRPQLCRPLNRQRLHPFLGTYALTLLSRRKKNVAICLSLPWRQIYLGCRLPVRGRFLKDLAPKEVVFFADDEILVLGFSKDLVLGEGVLSMKFNGTLNDQMRGFYRRYEFSLILNSFLTLIN